jgi:hypothetical protein
MNAAACFSITNNNFTILQFDNSQLVHLTRHMTAQAQPDFAGGSGRGDSGALRVTSET